MCTLEYSKKRRKLISGSWDKTARVWAYHGTEALSVTKPLAAEKVSGDGRDASQDKMGSWETELILEGHDEAVWGVTVIGEGPRDGCYLTGELNLPC